MDKKTISGVKIPERVERYIRKLKYMYILLNYSKNDNEKTLIEEEYWENPYSSSTDKEILIQNILSISQSKSFKRLLNKTMAHLSNQLTSDKTVKRLMHSISAAGLMLQYCSELKLNKELGMAIALGHDVGHTAFGHEGEKIFKEIALESNLGTYAHNLQSRLLLEDIDNAEVSADVLDGVQCHNGEKEEFEVPVNYDKTPEDSLKDLKECLVYVGKEREQIPGSFEGAAFRIIDKISYAGQDLADGFRERILDPRNLSPELKAILKEIGLDEQRINQLLSQDKDYSLVTIKRIYEQLKDFPVFSMSPGKAKRDLEECLEELEKLETMNFDDGPSFNNGLSRITSKLRKVSRSINLTDSDKIRFASYTAELDRLISQDTSGGNLAREIEKIFMEDFIKNSRGKDHPCMSEKMGDLMYDLIGYTQETVLPPKQGTPENNKLLRKTINKLVNHYANILLASGVIDEIIPQIDPSYEQEEKNANKENGIFDDIEALKADSKIEGHTRKLFAQNKEYFKIVIEVIKEAENNQTGAIDLTFREKVAKRIAIDYASRNNEEKVIKKARKKGLITKEEEQQLNARPEINRENFEILPSTDLYQTRAGMHNERMTRKIDKLIKCSQMLTDEKIAQDISLVELKEALDSAITTLEVIKGLYDENEDFKEKKTFFRSFKDKYREISHYIYSFRKSLSTEEERELDKMLSNKSATGAPNVKEWKNEAMRQAGVAKEEK